MGRYRCVLRELHRVGRPPLSHRADVRRIPEHVGQRDLGRDRLRRAARFQPPDAPAARRQVAGHLAQPEVLHENRAENAGEIRALVDVRRGDSSEGRLAAGKNNYPVERQTSNEVAIRSNAVTGEDLYLIAQQIDANGTVFFKAEVLPLVNLIWLAGFIFIGGTLIALWPDARESRRLAERYGYAAARA